MKITKTLFLVFFITLLNVSNVLAQDPPEPEPGPVPPPPPGAPIDQNLIILLVGALGLGTYTILKYKDIKKASI